MGYFDTETKNAVITNATITNDNHGVLSAWVFLDYGGADQGFGGYVLYSPSGFTDNKENKNYCGHFIWRVMEVAGVSEWSKIVGKTIRVTGNNEGIEKIGHIVKDIWFDPKREFQAAKEAAND